MMACAPESAAENSARSATTPSLHIADLLAVLVIFLGKPLDPLIPRTLGR